MARTRYGHEPDVREPMDDSRIRGLDIPATIGGFLAAIATLSILGGIAGAIIGGAAAEGGLNANLQEIGIASLVVGLVVLFVSFLVGGWVAGRMARYDGGRNGAFTVLWALLLGLVLAGIGAAFGERYDVTARINLPQFFTTDTFAVSAIVGTIVVLGVMLLGGLLGGRLGDRYHRRVDYAVAPGAYAPGTTEPAGAYETHERPATERHGFERDDDVVRRQDAGTTEPASTAVRGHEETYHSRDER